MMSGFKHVCLLDDNAPSHTYDLVKQILKSKKITVWSHPSYSPYLAQCGFFLFPKPFKTWFQDWNYVFQVAKRTLKRWDVHFTIWASWELLRHRTIDNTYWTSLVFDFIHFLLLYHWSKMINIISSKFVS